MRIIKTSLSVLIALTACTLEKPYTEPQQKFQAEFEAPAARTYVDGSGDQIQMHWTAGDAISIFHSTINEQYTFDGETGATSGSFSLVPAAPGGFTAGFELGRYYAYYPYNEATEISSTGAISCTLPTKQNYVAGSFGLGACPMVAVTASTNDYNLIFKNVVGFIRLQLYGSVTIKEIRITGNNNELLAGAATLTAGYGAEPVLTMASGAKKTAKLDCGAGVPIGADAASATSFWIAIPPTDFTGGFTVEITDVNDNVTTKATQNRMLIERNHVQPMQAFEVTGPVIPELTPVVNYGLPTLYINTPDAAPVESKEVWVTDSQAYLRAVDGTVTALGGVSIRGRGNTTWGYPKKPYAIKFDNKKALLGMPADKRWDLLANYVDRTRLRNDIALEMGRRLTGLEWTPKGQYVELVLNGTHLGNYYLCEHIKIASNRVDITEMKSTDVEVPAISGGYLLELGVEMDEPETNRFYTNSFPDPYPASDGHLHTGNTYCLPVMIKDPDDETIVPAQKTWIKNHINMVQGLIVNNNDDWLDYVDLDSFVDWMLVQEVVGNYEPLYPKSCFMYKDREGTLHMGPLWDFDWSTFTAEGRTFVYHYSIWYNFMKKNDAFYNRVVERWPAAKAAFQGVLSYVNTQKESLRASVEADWRQWGGASVPNPNGDRDMNYDTAVATLKYNLNRRINQMEGEIENHLDEPHGE